MKFFKIIMLLFLSLTITACSTARYSTKKDNYLKKSNTVHPIVVPPGASMPEQKPYYPVPSTAVHMTGRPCLKPPGLQ